MKRTILVFAFALIAFASTGQVFAQGTAPARPQAPATQPAANVPVSKMAVIYSEAFQDPKIGIARFIATLNKLNAEFQKVQDELTQTGQRLTVLQTEITNLQATGGATPAQIQAKIDTLEPRSTRWITKNGITPAKAKTPRPHIKSANRICSCRSRTKWARRSMPTQKLMVSP